RIENVGAAIPVGCEFESPAEVYECQRYVVGPIRDRQHPRRRIVVLRKTSGIVIDPDEINHIRAARVGGRSGEPANLASERLRLVEDKRARAACECDSLTG